MVVIVLVLITAVVIFACIIYFLKPDKTMEKYIKNYNNFENAIIYNFESGDGGLGDYIKFFMLTLTYCMNNNIRFYYKINNTNLEKYIRLKYNEMIITDEQISSLKNYKIQIPKDWYMEFGEETEEKSYYNYNVNLDDVFYFDKSVKQNVNNIVPSLPNNYISIHLRMGDNFLERPNDNLDSDTRKFSEEKLHKFIEKNKNTPIMFICDNNEKRQEMKNKYNNILITTSEIGHTGLYNTPDKHVLDAVTEFYILAKSKLIYGASNSGFSIIASKFKNTKFIRGFEWHEYRI